MSNTVSKVTNEHKSKFKPNLENYKVSLSYEGLVLKQTSENQSVSDLKRKHAR